MRVLLSSVGTRGDVQPIVALALRIRELGHQVRLCVPPNFVEWLIGLEFEAVPVGVAMRAPAKRSGPPLTAEQLRALRESMPDLISDQFQVLEGAMKGCEVILGANAHQYAARSIAELAGIPCVTALYAPVAIPSADHPPPPGPGERWVPATPEVHRQRWEATVRAWNERALERVNHNRVKRGLSPIDDVLRHNLGERPWLAADPILAPIGAEVLETGAWILEDSTPLPHEIDAFLEAGTPPVFLGFGSMPAPDGLAAVLLAAVRAVGRRAIVAQGWAGLELADAGADCLSVGEVNHQALFPRVAAVVHHGGAGTTATAARAGVPQVIAPMFSDQFYWASRVRSLGLGAEVEGPLPAESLTVALGAALAPSVASRARELPAQLRSDGAQIAAGKLLELVH